MALNEINIYFLSVLYSFSVKNHQLPAPLTFSVLKSRYCNLSSNSKCDCSVILEWLFFFAKDLILIQCHQTRVFQFRVTKLFIAKIKIARHRVAFQNIARGIHARCVINNTLGLSHLVGKLLQESCEQLIKIGSKLLSIAASVLTASLYSCRISGQMHVF